MKFRLIAIGIATLLTLPALAEIQLAITVDDLPSHGKLPPGVNRADVAAKMVTIFQKYKVPEVYGFINAAKIKDPSTDVEPLRIWRKAGYPLGNHTFTHPDLNKTEVADYLNNIDLNEKILQEMNGHENWRYFRYPFLHEGDTLEKRNAVRKHLQDRGYQVAQVTVDFEDWSWNDPYARCSEKRDQKSVDWLRSSYLEHAKHSLLYADSVSQYLFKRSIKHILLLHVGALDADILEDLLKLYISHGVQFISLSEAMKDEVYKIDPGVAEKSGSELIYQIAKSRGIKLKEVLPNSLKWPGKELEGICR